MACGLVNAAEVALNGPVTTFVRGDAKNVKDMVLLRPEAADMALAGYGMLDHDSEDGAPTNSEHWPVLFELAAEAILGVDGEKIVHPKARAMDSVLRTTSSDEVKKKYAEGIFDG